MVIIYFNFLMIQEANGTGPCRSVKRQIMSIILSWRHRSNTQRLISTLPCCLLVGSQAVSTVVSWPWIYGTVETCDPLPLLSPMQQTLHVESSDVPVPCFLLCVFVSVARRDDCAAQESAMVATGCRGVKLL